MDADRENELQTAGTPAAVRKEAERDPEREWKSHPEPWAGSGWAAAGFPANGGKTGGGSEPPFRPSLWGGFFRGLLIRVMVAALLLAGARFMFASSEPWALAGQAVVRDGLTQQMDFEAMREWYRTAFAGAPTFIPIFGEQSAASVNAGTAANFALRFPLEEGAVVRPYPKHGNGVEIAPPGGGAGAVLAADTGQVTLVSRNDGAGLTVVIRHPGGRTTVYGQLETSDVSEGDWVEAGERIGFLPSGGATAPGHLYFAVKENGVYVDPGGRLPHD